MIKIKVCGMRDTENIQQLVKLKPNYMGFIFYPASPRYAGKVLTREVLMTIPDEIKKTGVFVNSTPDEIMRTANRFGLKAVQLHGDETPETCKELRQRGLEVIKAFRMTATSSTDVTLRYKEVCDFFLFDTSTRGFGGSGRKFNWQTLAKMNIQKPFFLSGGIGKEDAETVLNNCPVRPYAVDLNSQFETEHGLKDIEALRFFIQQLRDNEYPMNNTC